MSWYQKHSRRLPWRETDAPYPIWVSEVMLQQTQVATVVPYYRRFMQRFPQIRHLAAADLQEVLKHWEGLGYYARARNFHRAAGLVISDYGGKVPDTWNEFRQFPGVGEYIAAAVLSLAFGQPYAVVDGNVKRVLARLYMLDAPVNRAASHKVFRKTADVLLDRENPGRFNQAIMELGALVCKPAQPVCKNCPLSRFCRALRTRQVAGYPKREKRRPIPLYQIAIGVVLDEDRVLITLRPTDGLLGGLWEFPGGKIKDAETPQAACIRELREEVGLKVAVDQSLTRIRHAYTHFRIEADVFVCSRVSGRVVLNGPTDYRWIRVEEIDAFAFPKANHKFIPELKRLVTERSLRLGGKQRREP